MSHRVSAGQSGGTLARRTSLWALAVFTFGVGDLATTLVGFGVAGVTEVGPVAGPLLSRLGPAGAVGLKFAAFAVSYGLWRLVPRPYAVGIPLGLAVVGVGVTCWNLVVVSLALSL